MGEAELQQQIDMISDAMRDAADELGVPFSLFVLECFRRILAHVCLKDIPA